MKTALATLAALGFATSAASACPMMKSAQYDTTVTASIAQPTVPMSTAQDTVSGESDASQMTGDAADDTVVKAPEAE